MEFPVCFEVVVGECQKRHDKIVKGFLVTKSAETGLFLWVYFIVQALNFPFYRSVVTFHVTE